MFHENRTYQWWMGPIVGAGAGVMLWLRMDDPRKTDTERSITMLAILASCTLAGAIVSALDYMHQRSAAQAQAGGQPPLPLLGYFFAVTGILLCWAPFIGVVLNSAALYSSRQRRGALRMGNWVALVIGTLISAASIFAIVAGK